MVVRRPSIGKRLIRRMPDWPADNFAQFSALPTPSGLTMPIPVMAMIGRPALSRLAITSPSSGFFDQSEPFAAPIADPGDDHLGYAVGAVACIAASGRWKQLAVLQDGAADAEIGQELALDPM